MAQHHFSIVWDGKELNLTEQIKFIEKYAKENYIRTMSWKDNTVQDRVCQYFGNPVKKMRRNWKTGQMAEVNYGTFKNKLQKKYTILLATNEQIKELATRFLKPFEFTTTEEKSFTVVNMFDMMANPVNLSHYPFNDSKVVSSEEELAKEIEALNLQKNQSVKIDKKKLNQMISYSKMSDAAELVTVEITTVKTEILRPWVVLTNDSIEAAAKAALSEHNIADNTDELTKERDRLVDLYNAANIACGRVRYVDVKTCQNKEQVKHYQVREQAGRDLKKVNKELGAIKKSMTKMAKKENGIEFDLVPYSVL